VAKLYTDNFTRADGDLDGDALSSGAAWLSSSGLFNIVSNQCVLTGIVGEDGPTAVVDSAVDTDTVYAEVDYALTAGTPGPIAGGLRICIDTGQTSGYIAEVNTDGDLNLITISPFSFIGFAAGVPTSGRLRVQRDNRTGYVTVKINATKHIHVVDTSQIYSASYRYAALSTYAELGDGTDSAVFGRFAFGDIQAPTSAPFRRVP